jgi:hypothetical protein
MGAKVAGVCLSCHVEMNLLQSWLHRCVVEKRCSICGVVFHLYKVADVEVCREHFDAEWYRK